MSTLTTAIKRTQHARKQHATVAPANVIAADASRAVSLARPPVRGEVFSINFIRRETFSRRARRRLVWAAVGYLMAHAIVMCLLVGSALYAGVHAESLKAQVRQHLPSGVETKGVQQQLNVLSQRASEELAGLNTRIARQRERFAVGSKLAVLTKTLPPRTWITNLSGGRKDRTLTLQVVYLVNPDAPRELPIKGWVDTLKADPVFRQGLKGIDVGSSSRKRQGKAELLSFQLTIQWQPIAAGRSKAR